MRWHMARLTAAASGHIDVNGFGDAIQLTGRVGFVEGSAEATHFLVLAGNPSGVVIVPARSEGLKVLIAPGLAVPSLAEVSFADTTGTLVRVDEAGLRDVVQAVRLACTARARRSLPRVRARRGARQGA